MKSIPSQIMGAVFWGIFIAVAPFEIVFGGAIIWLPLLAWRERARAIRYGFWPGFVLRLAVILIIVVGAANAPKHMDTMVGPVAFENTCLAELCAQLNREHEVRVCAFDDLAFEDRITFVTTTAMPRREVVAQLAKATNREPRFSGCLNGASILSGTDGTYYLRPIKAGPTTAVWEPSDSPMP